MSARLIDGKAIAGIVREGVRRGVESFRSETSNTPHLVVLLVGEDPASRSYVKSKTKSCVDVGMKGTLLSLPADAGLETILDRVRILNADPGVHGILVQLPLPGRMSEAPILGTLSPRKDVDGLTIENFGKLMRGEPRYLPCTPAGVMRMLEHERIVVAGKRVAIVGRSLLVGRPLAMMLSAKGSGGDATVVLCHSRTENLADEIRRADVVIVATGLVDTVVGDMLKPGAVVIDVGINRRPDGKLVGDVNFESASKVASAITPVPGGVGPMTVAMLLENTLKAAWEQHRARGD